MAKVIRLHRSVKYDSSIKTIIIYFKKSGMPWQILNYFFKVKKIKPKPNQNQTKKTIKTNKQKKTAQPKNLPM